MSSSEQRTRPRTLWLVRHAHAQEAREGQPDRERPLSDRGRERLLRAARALAPRLGSAPLVIASPWERAVATAEGLAGAATGARLVTTTRLSGPPTPSLLALLGALEAEAVVAVGHEPWLSDLANLLTGEGLNEPLKRLGAAELEGPLTPGEARLRRLWRPSELRSGPSARS